MIEANELKAKIKAIAENIEAVNILLSEFAIKTNIDVQVLTLQLTSPHKILSEVIKKLEEEKEELKNSIDKLEIKNKELKNEKESLIASANSEEKQYQRYLQDFEEWKKQREPEDNLDNQSVYSKLVPCICKAKEKRQVIIVTHNPNIAVACDAEQIIYCNMDKNSFSISYEAGAIEDPIIKSRVIDVLEGTMPAFDLRRKKYEN